MGTRFWLFVCNYVCLLFVFACVVCLSLVIVVMVIVVMVIIVAGYSSWCHHGVMDDFLVIMVIVVMFLVSLAGF